MHNGPWYAEGGKIEKVLNCFKQFQSFWGSLVSPAYLYTPSIHPEFRTVESKVHSGQVAS